MDKQENEKWYFKTWSLVVSFLVIGPFMLPLVWSNPRFSKQIKIIISLIVVILTCLLTLSLVGSLKSINDYYQLLSK